MTPYEVWKEQTRRIYAQLQAAGDVTRVAQRINKTLVREGWVPKIVQQRFEQQGPGWPPLSDSTVKERARLGFAAGPILLRSGFLRTAAEEGEQTVTGDTITMTLKDGAAPRYTGAGNAVKTRVNARRAMEIRYNRSLGAPGGGGSGRISDYAERLNLVRPFYGKPTQAEIAPMVARRNFWINQVVGAIADGVSLDSIGLAR